MKISKGFTLIELSISLLIMLSVLGGFLYFLSQYSSFNQIAQEKNLALSALQAKIEELSNDIDNITTYNNQTFSVPGLGQENQGFININEIIPNRLYGVNVVLTWQEASGREISESLNTVLVKR